MNINSTFTSTRTAITVNTAQVWTSKAMAQRCGPMCAEMCAPGDGRYSASPRSRHGASKRPRNPPLQARKGGKKGKTPDAPLPLHATRCNSKRHGKRCIILTIIIVIRLHRNVSPLVNTCRCFASSPLNRPTLGQ